MSRSPSKAAARAAPRWRFDADYFTFCNCDWGCPCNFNARPTHGLCQGFSVWRIRKGRFSATALDGVVFAGSYFWPGRIEDGDGSTRLYIDRRSTTAQREAVEAIGTGQAGGGFFALMETLLPHRLPTKVVDIHFSMRGSAAKLRIPDLAEAEAGPLAYPDGSIIKPVLVQPHGLEQKECLMVNAERWWVRDKGMRADHRDAYASVSRVRFDETGCIG